MAHAVTFPTAPAVVRVPSRRLTPVRPQSSQPVGLAAERVGVAPAAGLRLTRRGRAVAFVASLLVLLAVVVLTGRISAEAGPAGSAVDPVASVVVVQQGESLWQIARRIAPASDPRAVVTAIRELNDLGVRTVVPGQSLVVPAYAGS